MKKGRFFLFILVSVIVAGIVFIIRLAYILIVPLSQITKNMPLEYEIKIYQSGDMSEFSHFLDEHIERVFPDKMIVHAAIRMYSLHRPVKKGRYLINPKMSMWEVIDKITRGIEDPITVSVISCYTLDECLSRICANTLCNADELKRYFNENAPYDKFGVKKEGELFFVLGGTYQFYWSWNSQKIGEILIRETLKFWDSTRVEKGRRLGLTPYQVYVLASIISGEYKHKEEIPLMASVYINRLRRGMPLQADPTIKYLLKLRGKSPQRITKKDLQIQSPINTYLNKGLPPIPIYCTEKEIIDSVLNAPRTNFLYFCAREDMSGYHYFSTTYQEHISKCGKYQRELDKMGIYQ